MNKLAVIAISALAAFVSYCGWLAYHYQGGNDDNRYAPNHMHRIQVPPIAGIEPVRQQDVMRQVVAAATMQTDLQVNGKQIVVSSRGNMLDPERHDVAHALARAEYRNTKLLK